MRTNSQIYALPRVSWIGLGMQGRSKVTALFHLPFLYKHTSSAFLWGGEKSFIILMGVKYVFQIY